MKTKIPDELKADVPLTLWGKILTATPVVMTVVATMLAGLASSEMTRAQYDRSLAAQQQSKAGDQWSFFQAKRLRGASQRNTLDLLQNTVELHPLDPSALKRFVEQLPPEAAKAKTEMLAALETAAGQQTLAVLQQEQLPNVSAGPAVDPKVKAALEAIENSKPEPEIAPLVAQVNAKTLDDALRAARDQAQAFDAAIKPVNQTVDLFEKLLSDGLASGAGRSLNRDFTAARLRYTALRYDTEARLNQVIANLYELQVRQNNLSAERHHNRSQRFFYGMLAAQMAVIIATFAIAARKRNLLWSLAAAAGAAAVGFAVYVYLFL
jgi:uncharacterized protein YqgV (UPF0045/DUF77 family)